MRKTEEKIEGKPLIIATDGKITMIFFEGKIYGNGIREMQFLHKAPTPPSVEIEADSYPVQPMEMEKETFERYLESIMKCK